MKIDNLNLTVMKYFVDAVELSSFTKSAQKNHVSRPAISQAIKRLETELGFDVINHKKNSFVLTGEGRDFYLKAKNALESMVSIFSETTNERSSLKIGSSATLANALILPLVTKAAKDPKIHIQLKIGTSARIRQLLLDKEINLGFIIDDGNSFGFECLGIYKGNFLLLSKSGTFEGPLVTTEDRPEVLELKKILQKQKTSFETIQIESWDFCHRFASNHGTCLVPDLIQRKSQLKVIRTPKYQIKYEVSALMRNRDLLTKPEQTLLQQLEMSQAAQ